MLSSSTGCIYGGCMDSQMLGFNPSASFDDGSCIAVRHGCMDSRASNYDQVANQPCERASSGIGAQCPCYVGGCTRHESPNFAPWAHFDDGSCLERVVACTDSRAANYVARATMDSGECSYGGCTNHLSPNYNPTATYDAGNCISPVRGCTASLADNFLASAVVDDGSCTFVGCTHRNARNYNPTATVDSGLCEHSSPVPPQPTGPPTLAPTHPPSPSTPVPAPTMPLPQGPPPLPSPPLVDASSAQSLTQTSSFADESFMPTWAAALVIVAALLLLAGCYRYMIRRHPVAEGPKALADTGWRLASLVDWRPAILTAPSTSVQVSGATRLQLDRSGSGAIEQRATPRMAPPPSVLAAASEPLLSPAAEPRRGVEESKMVKDAQYPQLSTSFRTLVVDGDDDSAGVGISTKDVVANV